MTECKVWNSTLLKLVLATKPHILNRMTQLKMRKTD